MTASYKHRTEIGEGAFIGSNSSLVAPVKIGDGAYIGSGSVVTARRAGRCACGRARRTGEAKEGWAARVWAKPEKARAKRKRSRVTAAFTLTT